LFFIDDYIFDLNNFPNGLINLSIGSNLLSNNIILPESLQTLEIFNPDIIIHEIPEFSFKLPNSLKYLNT
jgi:hypothetical protein